VGVTQRFVFLAPLLALCLTGCSLRGKGNAGDLVTAYVEAARNQDRDAMRDLTKKDDQTEAGVERAIGEKLRMYRGTRDVEMETNYTSGNFADSGRGYVCGRLPDGKQFTDNVPVDFLDGKWYVGFYRGPQLQAELPPGETGGLRVDLTPATSDPSQPDPEIIVTPFDPLPGC
ncbi:MAG: hypothetical protein H0V86_07295, partial [Chloroflexia bacterium]|nr:hypothetical protein [Chloroflexia bacterium]